MQGHLLHTIKELEARKASLVSDVARGAAPDYPKYREKVGAIAELERTITTLNNFHQKIYRAEEPA